MKASLSRTVAIVALMTFAVLLPVNTSAYGAQPDSPTDAIDWQPCADALGVDCGTVTVPIDWSKTGGPSIEIALARHKAAVPAERVGSILMDPGGPGGRGVAKVKSGWSLSPAITARFDTVGFDPRGVGESHPVRCAGSAETAPYPEIPQNQEEFGTMVEHNRALGASCRKLTGPLFDFMDTKSVARDMDAIRAALGERKLTYYGLSYGTLMGEQYAEMFPAHIRALVLDSDMDHSQATTQDFLGTQAVAIQESFGQFASWCVRTTGCALHGDDVRAVFAELYSRASRGELTDVGSKSPISALDLITFTGNQLTGPSWLGLADSLEALRSGKPSPTPITRPAPTGPAVADPFEAVFCEDWRLPIRDFTELDSIRKALETRDAPDVKFSPQSWTATTGCLGWSAEVTNPQHRLSTPGAPPILMLNSKYDPSTPYEWAQRAAHQSGAVLLTYDGWGHGVYAKRVDCVVEATDRYLITGATPPVGTHCDAVEPPAYSALTPMS